MAATTTFSGLATGLDSGALIKSMLSIAKQPMTRLEAKKTANSAMSKKFTDIKTKLTALQTAAKALDTRSEAMVNKATSSDDKVFSVTSAGGSSLGSFDITVTSAAKGERTYSNSFDSSTEQNLIGAGQLTIQIGTGAATSIDVGPTDSLESVVGKINGANAGVTAGLIFNGSQYRLQVSSNSTGAANAITFGGSGATSLGLDVPANQFQVASDAVISIDNNTITSANNAISSAIAGVTINVVGAGTASIKVDRDPDGLKTKLEAFVKAYNDVQTAVNSEFAYVGAQKSNSLSGDSTLRSAQSDLRGMMSQSLAGLTSSFSSIGQLGITMQRDGTLSVDSDKLTKAINKDYEGVSTALAGNGTTKGLMAQVVDKIDPYVVADGSISNRIKNLATRSRDADVQLARMQVRMDKYEEQLTRQYAALEELTSGLQAQGNALTSIMGG